MPVKNLPEGKHHYAFTLDERFFEEDRIFDVEDINASVNVFYERHKQIISGYIEIEATAKMPCDRCLDLCNVDVETDADFTIRISEQESENNGLETVFFVSDDDEFCDITDFVTDEILLGLPQKRNHGLDENGNYHCSNDIAKLIDQYEVKENIDISSDPRWDGLKNIKFN